MITKATVKQLGKKYDRITRGGEQGFLVRHILQDGRLINQNGNLLNNLEIKRIKKENKEMWKMGGMIINLTSYSEPKVRPVKEKKITN